MLSTVTNQNNTKCRSPYLEKYLKNVLIYNNSPDVVLSAIQCEDVRGPSG